MEDTTAKGQRLRLACTECYRRKIKCDKTIPCSTCIKKGCADRCRREEDEAVSLPTVPAEQTTSHELIRSLLQRVKHLESKFPRNAEGAEAARPDPSHLALLQAPQPQDQNDQVTTPALARRSSVELPYSSAPDDLTSVIPEDDDAATVLEFLAWGRNKDAEYGSTGKSSSRALLEQEDSPSVSNVLFTGIQQANLDLMETLLPNHEQIRQLTAYHNTHLLWYHGSYSACVFNEDVDRFLNDYGGDVRHAELNIQWLALLFAVLTGGLACAPTRTRHAWGFGDTESSQLALQWYEACVSCLSAGSYIERHTIYSVEAISTLTIAAHILGRSNSQSILLSSAGRIAQSLGLHRLRGDTHTSTTQMRQREAGRRVFSQLCTQDWFQIPFSESYSLNPRFIKTDKPTNCNDDDLRRLPESVPTQISYCNYRYEIAALMPHLLDATSGCNTLFTRYEQVLKYDEKMRRLATASMPAFLSTGAPIDPEWPMWIGWARRSLAICAAHKIIMIHRRFLGLSLTNTAFSFTRRTCVAAAKTILKEALSANDEEGPTLWIEQAFSVAAGIVLCLDIAHRNPEPMDLEHHVSLMDKTTTYLRSFEASKIASRGAQLLSTLQNEVDRGSFRGLGRKRRDDTSSASARPSKQARTSHGMSSALGAAISYPVGNDPIHTENVLDVSQGSSTWEDHSFQYPIDITLEPQSLFDDLLSFQF